LANHEKISKRLAAYEPFLCTLFASFHKDTKNAPKVYLILKIIAYLLPEAQFANSADSA
jgi:hypothetical protein